MHAVRMLRGDGLEPQPDRDLKLQDRMSAAAVSYGALGLEARDAAEHGPHPQKNDHMSFHARHVADDLDAPHVAALKRGLALASDAIVLTLASPFFAVWALQRLVRKLANSKGKTE